MAVIALTIYIAFGVLALGGRLWMQPRRTGSTGYRGISRRLGIAGLAGGVSFIVAMVGGLVAPLLQLLRVVAPLRILNHGWINDAGIALAAFGLGATIYSQLDMSPGESASTPKRRRRWCALGRSAWCEALGCALLVDVRRDHVGQGT